MSKSKLLAGWILLWHYLDRRRRPAPVATTSAASSASRKNVAEVDVALLMDGMCAGARIQCAMSGKWRRRHQGGGDG